VSSGIDRGSNCGTDRGVDRSLDRNPDGSSDGNPQHGPERYAGRAVLALVLTLLGLAAGCAVGPRYQRPAATAPSAAVPAAWKTEPPWQQAAPKDSIAKGAWWQVFHDPALDAYEQQLLQANQSLLAARERLEQSRSLARVATSGFFPQLSADPGALSQGAGVNRPLSGAPTATSYAQHVFTIPFNISYEADLFGDVRHRVEAANASL